jgi:hypothetical protein
MAMIQLFNGMQSSLSMVYDREMCSMRTLPVSRFPRCFQLTGKLLASTPVRLWVWKASCTQSAASVSKMPTRSPMCRANDPTNDKWTSVAPLPQPIGSMGIVAVDGVIHAIGGASGTTADNRHTIAVHYIYDLHTDKWTDSTPLPLPRERFNLLAWKGKLYALGGRIENYALATVLGSKAHPRKTSPCYSLHSRDSLTGTGLSRDWGITPLRQ